MNNEQNPIKFAVVEYVTKQRIFNVYDALPVERLQLELVTYDPNHQRTLDRAFCYLTIGTCKLLAHLILTGAAAHPGWKLERFGGSRRDGQIESRTFRAEYDPANGRFLDNPWRLTIAIGAGATTATGGIAPVGEPHTRVQMRFPVEDFLTHWLEIRDFLQNRQGEIEGIRYTAQLDHYHKRQQQKAEQTAIAATVATVQRQRTRREGYGVS